MIYFHRLKKVIKLEKKEGKIIAIDEAKLKLENKMLRQVRYSLGFRWQIKLSFVFLKEQILQKQASS